MEQEKDELLTAGDVARATGLSRQRVNQLASGGRYGKQIAGRYWVFTQRDLADIKAFAFSSKGGRPKDELNLNRENETPELQAA